MRGKVIALCYIIILVLAMPLSAHASGPKTCLDPDNPERCYAVGVQKDEPAPFTGDLFTPSLAIHLHQAKANCPDRIEAAVTATASAFREDLKYQAILAAADRKVAFVEGKDAGRKAAAPGFWGHPATWSVITAAVIITSIIVGRELKQVEVR